MSPSIHEEASGISLPSSSAEVSAGAGEYCGFTVRETSGTTSALVVLYDNVSAASGVILEDIALNPGESTADNYPRPGRYVANGIYAQITGAIEGSVFT